MTDDVNVTSAETLKASKDTFMAIFDRAIELYYGTAPFGMDDENAVRVVCIATRRLLAARRDSRTFLTHVSEWMQRELINAGRLGLELPSVTYDFSILVDRGGSVWVDARGKQRRIEVGKLFNTEDYLKLAFMKVTYHGATN